MKIYVSSIFILFITALPTYGQVDIKENFRIYLKNNGESSNRNVPIILEEQQTKCKVLYSFDGKNVTAKTKEYVVIDNQFSFDTININYESIVVDLEQMENKLILKTTGDVNKAFKKFNGDKKRRLYIDVSNAVEITKKSWKVSALTIPLKVYLTNSSNSLPSFSNNIQTDVNLAFTIGKSLERYSYKKGREPKITDTRNAFAFLGFTKLELNENNTDGRVSSNNILGLTGGLGYQYGHGKLGISLLLGVDAPLSGVGKDWVFRYQPWLGFGVGYSIFK